MRIKKRRYWVFAFDKDSPRGGLDDLKFSFDTVEEFEEEILDYTNEGYTRYQILDTSNSFIFEGDLGTVTRWVIRNVGEERYEDDVY